MEEQPPLPFPTPFHLCFSAPLALHGGAENAGVENAGADCRGGKCRSGKCGSRLQGWKMQEWKMREQIAGVDKQNFDNPSPHF